MYIRESKKRNDLNNVLKVSSIFYLKIINNVYNTNKLNKDQIQIIQEQGQENFYRNNCEQRTNPSNK